MNNRPDTSLGPPLIGRTHTGTMFAESFYRIRTILLSAGDPVPRSILVASALQCEGRSTVAANLAIACAAPGRSVLLVDSDLRKPVQHSIFELENARGLAQVLCGEGDGELLVRQVRPCLDLLSSGSLPADPCGLIGSDVMARLLAFVREKYDLVILDSPPVSQFADAVALAQRVDAIVFVVRSSSTHRDDADRALKELSKVNPRIVGAVLNAVPGHSTTGMTPAGKIHSLPVAARGSSAAWSVDIVQADVQAAPTEISGVEHASPAPL